MIDNTIVLLIATAFIASRAFRKQSVSAEPKQIVQARPFVAEDVSPFKDYKVKADVSVTMHDTNQLKEALAKFIFVERLSATKCSTSLGLVHINDMAMRCANDSNVVAFDSNGSTVTSSGTFVVSRAGGLYVKKQFLQTLLKGEQTNAFPLSKDVVERMLRHSDPTPVTNVTKFTHDWQTQHIKHWINCIPELITHQNLRMLEIGSFEGRTTTWLLQDSLRGERACIDCVDTWDGSVENIVDTDKYPSVKDNQLYHFFRSNVLSMLDKKVFMHRGYSKDVLTRLAYETLMGTREKYDLVYVDGSHYAKDALQDAVIAFEMLKDGGFLVFDDYLWFQSKLDFMVPKIGVDSFVQTYKGRIKVIYSSYQVIVQKVNDAYMYETQFFDKYKQ